MIIRTAAEVDNLSGAELQSLALLNLSWKSGWLDIQGPKGVSSHRGHLQFKTSGFPTKFSNQRFTSREEYLKFRLKRKLGRKDGVLVDAEGKKELKAIKDAELKKQIEERKTKPLITFTASFRVRIEEWTPNPKNAIHFLVGGYRGRNERESEKPDIWEFQRAPDSPSQRICLQRAALNGKDLLAGLNLLDTYEDKLKEVQAAIARLPKLPDGVRIEGASGKKITLGQMMIVDQYNGGYIYLRLTTQDGVKCVKVTASGYDFMFRLSDLVRLCHIMEDRNSYEVVRKEKRSSPQASVKMP